MYLNYLITGEITDKNGVIMTTMPGFAGVEVLPTDSPVDVEKLIRLKDAGFEQWEIIAINKALSI